MQKPHFVGCPGISHLIDVKRRARGTTKETLPLSRGCRRGCNATDYAIQWTTKA
jgi:hypothetical protein